MTENANRPDGPVEYGPRHAAGLIKREAVIDREAIELEKIANVNHLDWKKLPPPQLAMLLCRIPFKGTFGEPDYYLKPVQALIWAMECFRLELSPFSGDTWFNPKANRVNITLQGKLAIARNQGWKIGVPKFERVPEDETKPLIAFVCELPVQTQIAGVQTLRYRASLEAWKRKSPMWNENAEHMLALRSFDKALSWVTGIGASELPGDADISGSLPSLPASPDGSFTPVVSEPSVFAAYPSASSSAAPAIERTFTAAPPAGPTAPANQYQDNQTSTKPKKETK